FRLDVPILTHPKAPSTFTVHVTPTTGTAFDVTVQILPAHAVFPTVVYPTMFARPIDPSGQIHWSSFLDQGGSPQQLVRVLSASQEWRAGAVASFYKTYLQRTPDSAGLQYFTDALGRGLTMQQVQAALAGSAEFTQLAGPTRQNGDDAFLNGLFHDALNRAVDPGALNYF